MSTLHTLRTQALALPETTEEPHFEKTSFRVKKKIIVTYDQQTGLACFRFTETDQYVFGTIDRTAIYPVPNKWGLQGWTRVHLDKITDDLLADLLRTAYCTVAPPKLAKAVASGPGGTAE